MTEGGGEGRDVRFEPIGVVRSPHTDPAQTPIQPSFAAGIEGRAEIEPCFAEGLRNLEGFSHLYLLYLLHRAPSPSLVVTPYLEDEPHGVFATRSPARPNPIGLSVVRLLGVEGSVLRLADLDILDGTPLLDIKPWVEEFDAREGARSGWIARIDPDEARRRGSRLDNRKEESE